MLSHFTSPKIRMSWCVHLIKALTRQHHTELRPFLQKYLAPDSVIIDVGAHAGQFAKLFSALVPDGHVYAFEPGSYALSILEKVKKIHRLHNVTIVPAGLSNEKTTATLYMPVKKSGSMGYGLSHLAKEKSRKEVEESISITTLDDFVQSEQLTKIDFIKADIEGWELKMLQGAETTLKKHRPVLMLEASDKWLRRAGDTRNDLLDFLTQLDYEIYGQDHKGDIKKVTPENGDIVCLPKK